MIFRRPPTRGSAPNRSRRSAQRLLVVFALVGTSACSSGGGMFSRASYASGGAMAPQSGPAVGTASSEARLEVDEDSMGDRERTVDLAAGLKMAPGAPGAPPPPAQYPSPAKQKPTDGTGGEGSKNSPGTAGPFEGKRAPILIYTADFTMSVFEVERSLDAVESLAKEAGGYLSRRDDQSITIRVPAEKFQDVVNGIEKVGDVLHRNVVSEDVTAEYRDLEVQLMNLQALRSRFEKLLEKAQKVEEALAIERELGRITGEMERIKGRLKLLTDLARYSTVTVSFQPRGSSEVREGPFVLPLPWVNDVGLRRLMAL